MEVSPAAKVGMIVVLALVMMGLVFSQLSYWKHREVGVPYYVIFDNVSGLQIGSPVRKAGVDIGRVTKIEIISSDDKHNTLTLHNRTISLTDKVRVTIYVFSKNEKLTRNSLFTIASTVSTLSIYDRQSG